MTLHDPGSRLHRWRHNRSHDLAWSRVETAPLTAQIARMTLHDPGSRLHRWRRNRSHDLAWSRVETAPLTAQSLRMTLHDPGSRLHRWRRVAFFSRLCDHLPVRVLISDLHHWVFLERNLSDQRLCCGVQLPPSIWQFGEGFGVHKMLLGFPSESTTKSSISGKITCREHRSLIVVMWWYLAFPIADRWLCLSQSPVRYLSGRSH